MSILEPTKVYKSEGQRLLAKLISMAEQGQKGQGAATQSQSRSVRVGRRSKNRNAK